LYNVISIAFMRPDSTYTSHSFVGTGIDFTSTFDKIKTAIELIRAAHNETRIVIGVGGATYYNWVKLNATSVAALVVDLGLDGVDIDYEPDTALCDYSTCCHVVSGQVQCKSDVQYRSVIVALRRALDSRGNNPFTGARYILNAATWSVGAYGEGNFSKAVPHAGRTGMMLNVLNDATSSAALDCLQIMAYNAAADYDQLIALAAYQFAASTGQFVGPILIGIALPSEASPGPSYTPPQAQQLAAKQVTAGGNGIMFWYIQGDTNYTYANALCVPLNRC